MISEELTDIQFNLDQVATVEHPTIELLEDLFEMYYMSNGRQYLVLKEKR